MIAPAATRHAGRAPCPHAAQRRRRPAGPPRHEQAVSPRRRRRPDACASSGLARAGVRLAVDDGRRIALLRQGRPGRWRLESTTAGDACADAASLGRWRLRSTIGARAGPGSTCDRLQGASVDSEATVSRPERSLTCSTPTASPGMRRRVLSAEPWRPGRGRADVPTAVARSRSADRPAPPQPARRARISPREPSGTCRGCAPARSRRASSSSAAAQAGSAGSPSRSTQNRYSQRDTRAVHGRLSSRDRFSPRLANAPSERCSDPGTFRTANASEVRGGPATASGRAALSTDRARPALRGPGRGAMTANRVRLSVAGLDVVREDLQAVDRRHPCRGHRRGPRLPRSATCLAAPAVL